MTHSNVRSRLAPSLLATLVLAGCGGRSSLDPGGGTGGNPGGSPASTAPGIAELRSAIPHVTSPSIGDAQKRSFVADANAFSLDLYRAFVAEPANHGQNVLLSPLSLSFAFGMTAAGAKGQTLEEMRKALHFTQPPPATNVGFNWLAMELAKRPAQALASQSSAINTATMDLTLVNAIFAQDGFGAVPTFLDALSTQYDAGVKVLSFDADPEGSRQKMNGWVDQKTQSRITDLFPPGSITGDVRFVLVDALSMGAPWALPFDESTSAAATFTKLDGTTASATLMHRKESASFPYVANADLEAAALPLLGEQLEVLLVAPKAGRFAAVESSLDGPALGVLRSSLVPTALDVAVPRFRLASDSVSLTRALQSLGMKLAFTKNADFSGISTTTKVEILDVLHKAMVSFDENGIEASAASGVVVGTHSATPPATPFVVNRPFFLGIRDRTTGVLLFWGRIVAPPA